MIPQIKTMVASTRHTKILFVDNNDIDNFLSQKLLETGEFETVFFRNPQYALSHLKETDCRYHLILISLYMPIIDGFGFIKKFRELELQKKHGVTCLFSAALYDFDKKKAENLKIPMLEKPLMIDELKRTLINN